MLKKIAALAFVATGTLAALTGCAPTDATADVTASSAPVVTDVWIRAIPDVAVDGNMTGLFMTVENPTDEDVYLVGGTTDGTFTLDPLDAHEVVEDDSGEMVMQDAEGGILIPAGSTTQLMPGGFHVMFWNLTQPIPVGTTVRATLNFSNGTSVDVEATAMTVEMGQEEYAPGTNSGMNP
jgi:copper(I)-binding protein